MIYIRLKHDQYHNLPIIIIFEIIGNILKNKINIYIYIYNIYFVIFINHLDHI